MGGGSGYKKAGGVAGGANLSLTEKKFSMALIALNTGEQRVFLL